MASMKTSDERLKTQVEELQETLKVQSDMLEEQERPIEGIQHIILNRPNPRALLVIGRSLDIVYIIILLNSLLPIV